MSAADRRQHELRRRGPRLRCNISSLRLVGSENRGAAQVPPAWSLENHNPAPQRWNRDARVLSKLTLPVRLALLVTGTMLPLIVFRGRNCSAHDQLGGEATVDFLPRGVVCTVICTLDEAR